MAEPLKELRERVQKFFKHYKFQTCSSDPLECYVECAAAFASRIQSEARAQEKEPGPKCPKCGSENVSFNFRKSGRHRAFCRECDWTKFMSPTQFFSPSPQERWVPVSEWLTARIEDGRGALELSTTENGDIGIWRNDSEEAWGTGDTAEEAILAAMRKYPNGKDFPAPPAQPSPQASDKEAK